MVARFKPWPVVSICFEREKPLSIGDFRLVFCKKPAIYSVNRRDYHTCPSMNASPQRISFFKPRPENWCVYCNATSYGHPLTEIEANEEAVTRES